GRHRAGPAGCSRGGRGWPKGWGTCRWPSPTPPRSSSTTRPPAPPTPSCWPTVPGSSVRSSPPDPPTRATSTPTPSPARGRWPATAPTASTRPAWPPRCWSSSACSTPTASPKPSSPATPPAPTCQPAGTPEHGRPQAVASAAARRALRNLYRLSLISHDPDDKYRSIRMHALAQRATTDALDQTTTKDAIHAAADALLDTWPDIET